MFKAGDKVFYHGQMYTFKDYSPNLDKVVIDNGFGNIVVSPSEVAIVHPNRHLLYETPAKLNPDQMYALACLLLEEVQLALEDKDELTNDDKRRIVAIDTALGYLQ